MRCSSGCRSGGSPGSAGAAPTLWLLSSPAGSSSPRMADSRLLLPLPTGPVSATRVPAGMDSSRPCSTGPVRSPAASAEPLVLASALLSPPLPPHPKLPAMRMAAGAAVPGSDAPSCCGGACSGQRRNSARRRADTTASTHPLITLQRQHAAWQVQRGAHAERRTVAGLRSMHGTAEHRRAQRAQHGARTKGRS